MNKFDIWDVFIVGASIKKLGDDLNPLADLSTICSLKGLNLTAAAVRKRLIAHGWRDGIIVVRSPLNYMDNADN